MGKLTAAELHTWKFLEGNKLKVLQLPIAELAELAHVSPSTIIRTLKKQGFSGISEYKNELKHQKTNHFGIHGLNSKANLSIMTHLEEIVRTVNMLDAETLIRVMEEIERADSVVVLARGLMVRIADELAKHLQFLDVFSISCYQDSMFEHIDETSENTFIIALSFSGETRMIVNAVQNARQKGRKVLSITSNHQSSLASQSDFVLLTSLSKFDLDESEPKYNLLPIELMTQILVDLYTIYKEEGKINL